MRKFLAVVILLSILSICVFTGCSKSSEYELSDGSTVKLGGKKVKYKIKQEDGKMISENSDSIKIKFEMEDGGVFAAELYPEYAPETVQNFADLVDDGFYDGLTFHRIIPGFVAQGGDPLGNGTGGSGSNITGEFAKNGCTSNTLKHEKGVISMARAMDYDSASSQFFICLDKVSYLDGEYAAFGKVVYGMDKVEALADVATDANDKPLTPVVIKKVTIITDKDLEELTK